MFMFIKNLIPSEDIANMIGDLLVSSDNFGFTEEEIARDLQVSKKYVTSAFTCHLVRKGLGYRETYERKVPVFSNGYPVGTQMKLFKVLKLTEAGMKHFNK